MPSWVYRWVLQGCRWTRRCNSLNWRGWGFELQDVYSEGLHILQNSSVNLLRSIPRNPLGENQRSFCWIPLFLQNVKKRTQNYAYSVSSRIVTDANEIFFERESDRNDFFSLTSVNYNQSIMLTYEISRFSSLPAACGTFLKERRCLLLGKRPKRRGEGWETAVFTGCICPKEPIKNLTSMSS